VTRHPRATHSPGTAHEDAVQAQAVEQTLEKLVVEAEGIAGILRELSQLDLFALSHVEVARRVADGVDVGDVVGFAAATFLRGIPFVQVPTTVLAMVDASIGGKTGVNLAQGKNLVGAFHQPRGVYIDVATLRSLPARERAAGFAELVKAAAIWDAGFFDWIEPRVEAFLRLDPRVVVPALERACAIKAEVVARDEREGGLRRLLNFGHTLAHAIEKHARYRGILHGEAVAIGMSFAAERSEALGFSPAGTAARLVAILERAGLPTRAPSRPRSAYLSAIAVDKKKQGGKIHFVVLDGIGAASTVALAPRDILPPGWKP